MKDWNVVVTVHKEGFGGALNLLEQLGEVNKTDYFNVLVMRVGNTRALLENLRSRLAQEPGILNDIASLIPLQYLFTFQSPEAFEEKSGEIVSRWVPLLAGKSFHVRMRRRGFKGRLSSMEEERFLDELILSNLDKLGNSGKITFEDPDYIVAVQSIGTKAGLSLWSREDLHRYEFLKLG